MPEQLSAVAGELPICGKWSDRKGITNAAWKAADCAAAIYVRRPPRIHRGPSRLVCEHNRRNGLEMRRAAERMAGSPTQEDQCQTRHQAIKETCRRRRPSAKPTSGGSVVGRSKVGQVEPTGEVDGILAAGTLAEAYSF